MEKKFKEFVTEAKKGTGFAEHDEAHSAIKKHTAALEHAEGDHEEDPEHIHIGAVHPKKVEKVHAALKSAGFKHHGDKAGAHYGAHSHDTGDYHHYSKGDTHVRVSTKPNTYGKHETTASDHHHVEIHTSKAGDD